MGREATARANYREVYGPELVKELQSRAVDLDLLGKGVSELYARTDRLKADLDRAWERLDEHGRQVKALGGDWHEHVNAGFFGRLRWLLIGR